MADFVQNLTDDYNLVYMVYYLIDKYQTAHFADTYLWNLNDLNELKAAAGEAINRLKMKVVATKSLNALFYSREAADIHVRIIRVLPQIRVYQNLYTRLDRVREIYARSILGENGFTPNGQFVNTSAPAAAAPPPQPATAAAAPEPCVQNVPRRETPEKTQIKQEQPSSEVFELRAPRSRFVPPIVLDESDDDDDDEMVEHPQQQPTPLRAQEVFHYARDAPQRERAPRCRVLRRKVIIWE